METSGLTCADVDARDLEWAYVTERLDPEEAEAFEAHFFGCDRCWGLVRQAAELSAAAKASPTGFAARATLPRRRRFRGLVTLAAAAVLVLAVELWLRPSSRPPAATFRGGDETLRVAARATPDSVAVSWERRAGADAYRVRLFAADGHLLAERRTADTGLTVPRATLHGARAYWEIDALDALRQTLARSALVPALTADTTR